MSINQKKYVQITSGVGGEATVSNRELIARLMTTNQLAPFGSVLEFTSLDNVGSYFGTTSNEYKWASKYFGFISKDIRQAQKISFARYAPVALAPMIISTIAPTPLATFKAIETGSMNINMGGSTYGLSNLDFSAASSLSDVASTIETAIQANAGAGALWTSATVTFSNNSFVLTGGETGTADIQTATATGSGIDVSVLVGWNVANMPIVSLGADIETVDAAMARISDISNNFGSFAFIETLTTEQISAVATWNNAQNVLYMYSVSVNATNANEVQTAVTGINGTCLTLDLFNAYAEFMPCAILATTNYQTGTNSVNNYMFQQFPSVLPSVTTDANSALYDGLLINYNGATQQAGKVISFYQRGVLQGNISDIGVYCNEMWMKDAFTTEFLNLLLAFNQLPANEKGANMARGAMQGVIETALTNGTISQAKPLTNLQKAYITQVSGDNTAWRQVASVGYWVIVTVTSQVVNGVTEYHINYVLIYAKGDSIKKVVGQDILI